MIRVIKSLLIGLIGGPVIVLGYSFPGIFTDTRNVIHLMAAGAVAGAVGFVLLGFFQNASFWVKALIGILAGALAGLSFGLLRRGEMNLLIPALLGAVLLPLFVLCENGFKLWPKSKPSSTP